MAETKSATLTVRVQPRVKEGLKVIAEQEHRGLANMIEVMIRDYCAKSNIAIDPQAKARPYIRSNPRDL